jgi:hypothetical protein
VSHRDDLSADVATRIAQVVETELRNQVAEARRRLDAEVDERLRRLRGVTDSLVERAESVSLELDGLAAALRDAAADSAETANAPLGGHLDGAPEPPEAVETAVSPAPSSIEELEAELGGAPPPEAYRPTIVARPAAAAVAAEPPSDAARLVAVEMALAGSSRDDVDRHLRSAYNVGATGDLLDDVFGR